MIENQKINGRPALIAYVNENFEPVDPDAATLLKVTFTDEEGGVGFFVPDSEQQNK